MKEGEKQRTWDSAWEKENTDSGRLESDRELDEWEMQNKQ